MKVRLVTSWGEACGIAEHSAMLKEAVEAADSAIEVTPCSAAIDSTFPLGEYDLLHLNYQAALHSRWTPLRMHQYRNVVRKPVLVTYHDSGVPNSEQCKEVIYAADAAVVHEDFDDLPAEKTHYWRMGVPGWQRPIMSPWKDDRPVVGTVGFPFGWKNYDALCEVTARAGWALLLIAPGASKEQIEGWYRRQPNLIVRDDFVPREIAVGLLTYCDATAFTYVTHNTGQSGALLLGIAARKPVIALSTCRQFRALYNDPLGQGAIHWCESFEQVEKALHWVPIQRVDPGIVALAERESWSHLGRKYAQLYRGLTQ